MQACEGGVALRYWSSVCRRDTANVRDASKHRGWVGKYGEIKKKIETQAIISVFDKRCRCVYIWMARKHVGIERGAGGRGRGHRKAAMKLRSIDICPGKEVLHISVSSLAYLSHFLPPS